MLLSIVLINRKNLKIFLAIVKVYNNLSLLEEEVTGHAENGYDKIRMNDSSDFSKTQTC
jgi:hypothetical protein